jgi:hypothetical protein
MARRAAPALYELMRRPGSPSAGGGDASVSASPRRTGNAPGLPSTFEVSLAKAAVIGATVVVAIAIAYGIGVQRGGHPVGPVELRGPDARREPVAHEVGLLQRVGLQRGRVGVELQLRQLAAAAPGLPLQPAVSGQCGQHGAGVARAAAQLLGDLL